MDDDGRGGGEGQVSVRLQISVFSGGEARLLLYSLT